MATAAAACNGGGLLYYKVLSVSMLILLLRGLVEPAAAACSVDAIYSFGDSIADTGNLLREGPVGFFASIGSYPYGQTLRKPTGRCSDGLLIIDYFGTYLLLITSSVTGALIYFTRNGGDQTPSKRSDGAEPVSGEPVPGQGSRLRQRRQLRGGRCHGARPVRLAAERRYGSAGKRAAELPARLVQGAPQRHLLLARR